ncbi:hypothetical protein K438DRAFT_2026473 [Mycena galopus ATCC 62051]|nr:hypothetical protein K438DRAFT_2026473 [Mycena galopus ATCC 62051]
MPIRSRCRKSDSFHIFTIGNFPMSANLVTGYLWTAWNLRVVTSAVGQAITRTYATNDRQRLWITAED